MKGFEDTTQFENQVLKLVYESTTRELRYSEIKRGLLRIAELINEQLDESVLDVRLTRRLKTLVRDRFLDKDDRGHKKGVFYSIPSTNLEMAKWRIFAKDDLPSRIGLMMRKLGPSRRVWIHGFPLIFVYSALLWLRKGNQDQFNFFLEEARKMNRLAAEAFWDDLIDEYVPTSQLTKDQIDKALADIEGTHGRTNVVVRMAFEAGLFRKNLVTVVDRVLTRFQPTIEGTMLLRRPSDRHDKSPQRKSEKSRTRRDLT